MARRLGSTVVAMAANVLLQGCATAPVPQPAAPLLRLSPMALGCSLSVQQRIDVEVQGRVQRSVDVLLEVDNGVVSLALVAVGQTLAHLRWDGRELVQRRASWAPDTLPGERILSELQMAGWPLAAVQQILPAGWQMVATASGRELRHEGEARLRISYGDHRAWTLEDLRQNYRLMIHTLSRSVEPIPGSSTVTGPACF